MRSRFSATAILVAISLTMGSCATSGPDGPEDIDAKTTASVPKAQATPAAAFIGELSRDMDADTAGEYLAAQETALSGTGKIAWESATDAANGTITAVASAARDGMSCARYESVVWISGYGRLVEGEACRRDGGPWLSMGFKVHE